MDTSWKKEWILVGPVKIAVTGMTDIHVEEGGFYSYASWSMLRYFEMLNSRVWSLIESEIF